MGQIISGIAIIVISIALRILYHIQYGFGDYGQIYLVDIILVSLLIFSFYLIKSGKKRVDIQEYDEWTMKFKKPKTNKDNID
jgi:hypothetical protein